MSGTEGVVEGKPHRVSVVIPVYQGELTLPRVVREISGLAAGAVTPLGHPFVVTEVLLVHDHGPDGSPRVLRELAAGYPFVRPIWLSRNFGQHAATLAGMASSSGEWIVTMDEDGQHDPADIGRFLDTALSEGSQLVYAQPTNPAPHGPLRNLLSKGAKVFFSTFLSGEASETFQSYRLVLGEIGRSVAAYAGSGVYLDVALGWVVGSTSVCPVQLRQEGRISSGYNLRRLMSHFWRLVLSSGTRGLRIVSGLGLLFGVGGTLYAMFLLAVRVFGRSAPEGWTSTMVVVLVSTGAVLFSLGVIAEYVGVAVSMAMGKPPYLIVGDPAHGPLGRTMTPSPLGAAEPGE